MRITFAIAVGLAAGLVSPLHADELTLADGGKLTGRIVHIDADGRILADLAATPGTVALRPEQIRHITLSDPVPSRPPHPTTITLTNGDTLPCEILSLTDRDLIARTATAGTLTIPRDVIRSAMLGVRPRRILYQAPDDFSEWHGQDVWHVDGAAFVSSARGTLSRAFPDLPASYSVSFKLSWERRPNFQIFFNSPTHDAPGGRHDRYYLQFAAAGFELKRQSSTGTTYHTLASIPQPPESFDSREVEIEIRYDHQRHLILLYLDGSLQGRYPDPLPESPDGRILALHSNLSGNAGHTVTGLTLREWDAAGDHHEGETQGEADEDSLIDDEGQRFGGRIIGTSLDASHYLFKSPHHPQALEIPADKVATLFFRNPTPPGNHPAPLVFGLAGGGSLAAASCLLTADVVRLSHPLLGDLELPRSAIRDLTRHP